MGTDFVIADVFANGPGEGNQLAVFADARDLGDAFMQRAANEIGYSETTFILPPETSGDDLRLRIFTPRRELPFAGHPIVGSAVVAGVLRLAPGAATNIRFGTGVGTIEVEIDLASERSGRAEMRQPIPRLLRETTYSGDVEEAARALGVPDRAILVDRSPITLLDNGIPVLIVPLDSLATVRDMRPNPNAIAMLCERVEAITLLAFTTETVNARAAAHCRVFAPGAGVFEDAATGSANGPLGAYLVGYELVTGERFEVEQGYEMGRPSALHVTARRAPDGSVDDVRVAGGVFITGEGKLYGF
jgi:trans-2,3-dihydro-3-hydroxyanthranilate isomerase